MMIEGLEDYTLRDGSCTSNTRPLLLMNEWFVWSISCKVSHTNSSINASGEMLMHNLEFPYTFSQEHISCDLRYFLFLLSQRQHAVTHFLPPNFPFSNTEEATETIENIYQDMLRWVQRMLPTKRILCLHNESVWLGSWSARSPAWARLQRASIFHISVLEVITRHPPTKLCSKCVLKTWNGKQNKGDMTPKYYDNQQTTRRYSKG